MCTANGDLINGRVKRSDSSACGGCSLSWLSSSSSLAIRLTGLLSLYAGSIYASAGAGGAELVAELQHSRADNFRVSVQSFRVGLLLLLLLLLPTIAERGPNETTGRQRKDHMRPIEENRSSKTTSLMVVGGELASETVAPTDSGV